MSLLGRMIKSSILLFLLLAPSISQATSRLFEDRLSGVQFAVTGSGISTVYNAKISFKFKSQDGLHSPEYIEEVICDVSRIVFEYLEHNSIEYRDRKPDIVLDFYEVRLSVINDISRFERDRYYPSSDMVYGIWDPIPYDSKKTAIIVSTHNFDLSNRELISHELGHFWYDRLGLKLSSTISHEEFAEIIEDLYVNTFKK